MREAELESLTLQRLFPPPIDAFPKSSLCLVLPDMIYNPLGPVKPTALVETREQNCSQGRNQCLGRCPGLNEWWSFLAAGEGATVVAPCEKLLESSLGSKWDPPLAEAKAMSDGGCASAITSFRRAT